MPSTEASSIEVWVTNDRDSTKAQQAGPHGTPLKDTDSFDSARIGAQTDGGAPVGRRHRSGNVGAPVGRPAASYKGETLLGQMPREPTIKKRALGAPLPPRQSAAPRSAPPPKALPRQSAAPRRSPKRGPAPPPKSAFLRSPVRARRKIRPDVCQDATIWPFVTSI